MKRILAMATTLFAIMGTATVPAVYANDAVDAKVNAVYNSKTGAVQPQVVVGYRSKLLPGVSVNPFVQMSNVDQPAVYGLDVTYDLVPAIAVGAGVKGGLPQTVYYGTVVGKYALNDSAYLSGQVKIPTNSAYGTDVSAGLGYKF